MSRPRIPYLKAPSLDLSRPLFRGAGQAEALTEIRRKLLLAAASSEDGVATLYVDIDGTVRIARGAPDDPLMSALRVWVYDDGENRPSVDTLREHIAHHVDELRAAG